ncbi:MAG: patatin-like phospholipase family protein [Thermotogota bacterium]
MKIGIALGGGGTKGFAHLGVLKALEEKSIVPNVFSGTSAGAIVAALLSFNKKPDEIYEILKDLKLMDAAKLKFPKKGFASLEKLKEKLEKIFDNKNIEDLNHPLFIGVTNLNTGKAEYLNKGNITKAIQASSSIPILFTPVEINGNQYIDGGLVDNVPINPLTKICDKIIAIDIMPTKEVRDFNNIGDIINRIFDISISMQGQYKKQCDLLIELEKLPENNILDTSKNEKMFEIGYKYVKNMSEEEFSNILS